MSILISAGPMRTYIDPIRFIQNASTGVLGAEIVASLSKHFSKDKIVTLLGPVDSAIEQICKTYSEVYKYETSSDYRELLAKHFPDCDLFISASAVLDFNIMTETTKIPRESIKALSKISFDKEDVPDFVGWVCKELKTSEQKVFAFSLDTAEKSVAIARAKEKLLSKKCDWIFVNYATKDEGPSKEFSSGTILDQSGAEVLNIEKSHKRQVAEQLVMFLKSQQALQNTTLKTNKR